MKHDTVQAGTAKPFLWFGSADVTLGVDDLAVPRSRLTREMASILGYMAKCDLEKPNEPVVVLFSRLSADVMRSGAALPLRGSFREAIISMPIAGDVIATEHLRVETLRRAIEEARDTLNPRLIIIVPVQQPWLWTIVFLRSHDHLRPALHRLAPAAVQLVADQPQVPLPRLVVLDDLTPGKEALIRLRPRLGKELRPLLAFMGQKGIDPNERLPVLCVCVDVDLLAQRFVTASLGVNLTASKAAVSVCPGLSDLSDAEMQRALLARDRLFDVVDTMQPRLLVLMNWLRPDPWVVVLCRHYKHLVSGLAKALPNHRYYIWVHRRVAKPTDSAIFDICYSNTCPRRGAIQRVMFCPKCETAKYCSMECQNEHWAAGHSRFCDRLRDTKPKLDTVNKINGSMNLRTSLAAPSAAT